MLIFNYPPVHESDLTEQDIESEFTEQDLELRLSSFPLPRNIVPSSSQNQTEAAALQSSNGNGSSTHRRCVHRRTPNHSPDETGARVRRRRTANHSPESSQNKNPSSEDEKGSNLTITPPFPWATENIATVHSVEFLMSSGISKIGGEAYCKDCHKQYWIEFDLIEKFNEVGSFIALNKHMMRDRAPSVWMNPELLFCGDCNKNSVKPVIAAEKEEINWLFLLLGQMLGLCTLEQLKYFCKYNGKHRTGAKNRVLYMTYLALCKHLDPSGPFDVKSLRK